MSDYDMSIHTNPDARAWARFFAQSNPQSNIPEDVMAGWFANAMMAMHDHLKGNPIHNGDHAQYVIDHPHKHPEADHVTADVRKYGREVELSTEIPNVYSSQNTITMMNSTCSPAPSKGGGGSTKTPDDNT